MQAYCFRFYFLLVTNYFWRDGTSLSNRNVHGCKPEVSTCRPRCRTRTRITSSSTLERLVSTMRSSGQTKSMTVEVWLPSCSGSYGKVFLLPLQTCWSLPHRCSVCFKRTSGRTWPLAGGETIFPLPQPASFSDTENTLRDLVVTTQDVDRVQHLSKEAEQKVWDWLVVAGVTSYEKWTAWPPFS